MLRGYAVLEVWDDGVATLLLCNRELVRATRLAMFVQRPKYDPDALGRIYGCEEEWSSDVDAVLHEAARVTGSVIDMEKVRGCPGRLHMVGYGQPDGFSALCRHRPNWGRAANGARRRKSSECGGVADRKCLMCGEADAMARMACGCMLCEPCTFQALSFGTGCLVCKRNIEG